METKNKHVAAAVLAAALSFGPQNAGAENIAMNTAQMQALDKITGQMSLIDVPVNGEVVFGSFSVVVRSCQTTPPEETPENYAFVDVADTGRDGKTLNIFKGWMVSSSPSLNSVEHPIYDVWLLKCLNTQVPSAKLLSAQQLEERDRLEKQHEQNLSKEAKIAQELQAEQERREEQRRLEQEEEKRRQDEAREFQIRQQEIDKEIQTEPALNEPELPEDAGEGEGPVSLLSMGRSHHAPDKTAEELSQTSENASVSVPDKAVSEDEKAESAPAGDLQGTTIIIEDTHHETLHQDLNLPADINEIIPETQPQESTNDSH